MHSQRERDAERHASNAERRRYGLHVGKPYQIAMLSCRTDAVYPWTEYTPLPELPEVETVRRALQPVMEGARFEKVVARRPDLRAALPSRFAVRLRGQTVVRLGRRGKYLVADLSSGQTLLMHLGMSGSFRIDMSRTSPVSHDHVVFHMSSGAIVTFNDPRRFGMMELVASRSLPEHRAFRLLGPEPLTSEFDAVALARLARGRRTTLKAFLSDQRLIAGLGNIYASEALHYARLSPQRRASTIATPGGEPRDSARRLVAAIKKVLVDALKRAERSGGEEAGGEFRVYDHEGERCLRRGCRGVVRRIVQSGRSTFYCPVCQG
jgi:formamidopyrimidine-DNA glycosylase